MIEQPPHTPDTIIREQLSLPGELLSKINRINDDYLYWSEVKYRTEGTNLSAHDLWQIVKKSRAMRDVVVWTNFGLHFSLTNKMQKMCHEFDLNFGGSRDAMKLFPQDKLNQELYLISSIMEEAISSSQMEGASTSREVAKEMLKQKKEPRNRSERMIQNNYQTIQFISQHKREPLTPQLLMQVHSLMTEGTLDNPDDAGQLRTHDRIVVGISLTGEIVHHPPTCDSLNDFVVNLCSFFNSSESDIFLHPIIKAFIIHFLVAYYHPFVDGNGRTARALFYWYMLKEDYWLVEYLSISRIIYKSKAKYEKSFLYTESDGNDLGYFITYNLEVLEKAFEGLKKYLQTKQAERKRADRFMHIGGISRQQSEILRMYYDMGDITLEAKDIVPKFGVSRYTAKTYLDGLVEKGLLSRIQLNGRTHAYVRSDNFDTLISNKL